MDFLLIFSFYRFHFLTFVISNICLCVSTIRMACSCHRKFVAMPADRAEEFDHEFALIG